LDAELVSIDAEIQALQQARQNILKEKELLQKELATTRAPARVVKSSTNTIGAGSTNYTDPAGFEWTDEVKKRMRAIFGIKEFRLCQEGYVPRVSVILCSYLTL
jgi:ATP-dependent DNA helicase Q1